MASNIGFIKKGMPLATIKKDASAKELNEFCKIKSNGNVSPIIKKAKMGIVGLHSKKKERTDIEKYGEVIRRFIRRRETEGRNTALIRAYTMRAFARSQIEDDKGAIGDFSKAIALYEKLPATEKRNSEIAIEHYNRGNNKIQAGDYGGAVEDYSKSIEFFIKQPSTKLNREILADCYLFRATAKEELGYNKGAKRDIQMALASDPRMIKRFPQLFEEL